MYMSASISSKSLLPNKTIFRKLDEIVRTCHFISIEYFILILHEYYNMNALDWMDTKSVFFYVGLCISNFEEWQPVESITSTLRVFHSHIGEILYEGKDSTSLRE